MSENFGFNGAILRVNLSTGKTEIQKPDKSFYRTYMGGAAMGSFFLLKETKCNFDPLSEENIITIAPGITTGASVTGVSRCAVTAVSPETNAIGDSQLGGSIGPIIKKSGFDAIVIKGKAKKPVYIFVDNENVQIQDASDIYGKSVIDAHEALINKHGDKNISIIQCGPAGEKQVRFACLMGDLNNVAGRCGMGAVFGSKNLRAVVVKGDKKINFAYPEGLKNLAKLATERLPGADFPSTLKKLGTPGVLGFQCEAGNLATHNYTRSFHEDYKKLDGENVEKTMGAGKTTCFACIVGCRRKVKAEKPYKVTDKIGGPEFETLGLLGSNLDITDPVAVAKANELCNNYGIDTLTMGGLVSYLCECVEKGILNSKDIGNENVKFANAKGLLWCIEKTCARDGIGNILADGFEKTINHFGEKTRKYAVHVKGHGFAVHVPQVKPSQALMYGVVPFGADHMSCEHDWLLAGGSEASFGLGILGQDTAPSMNLNKVRASVYSQYFYSVLDTLGLCMFCWGPGNLFKYKDLEDLLYFTTGMEITFFELMKVGERRINLMRQVNTRRGFTRSSDLLPDKIHDPIPDGPAKGRGVDKESYLNMLDNYYDLMGWDIKSGNPSNGKLKELGLEWTI